MKGFNKHTCVKFNSITSEKQLVFALCDKMIENGIHITQDKVYTPFDDEKTANPEYVAFLVEKILYNSHSNTKQIDAENLVKNYYDWICYELGSREALTKFLT